MSRLWRGVLKIALGLFIAGAALAVAAFVMGGRLGTVSANAAVISQEYDFAGEKVSSLNLSIQAGALSIVEGDELRVVTHNVYEDSFVCELQDGVLTITDDNGGWTLDSLLRWSNLGDDYNEITLYVPRNFKAEHIDLDIAAGSVRAERLSAKSISLNLKAGELLADELYAESLDAELSTGAMTIYTMELDRCNLNLSAGSAYLGGSLAKSGSFSCAAGNVELRLTGSEEDYTIDLDSGAGLISINGEGHSFSSRTIKGGKGAAELELDCDAGKIAVDYV